MSRPSISSVADLWVTQKVASGDSVLDRILPTHDVYKLMQAMEKEGDSQSSDLAGEVYQKLAERLTLTDNEQAALNRLLGSVQRIGSWDTATQRNNIFKAADLLKIKLPSYMFASTQKQGAKARDVLKDEVEKAVRTTLGRLQTALISQGFHPSNAFVSFSGKVTLGADILDPQYRDEATVRLVVAQVLGHRDFTLERKTVKVHREDQAWWFSLAVPDIGIITL